MLVCIANASIGLFFPTIGYRLLWVTDGLLKIGFGSWMLLLTYRGPMVAAGKSALNWRILSG